MVFNVEVSCNRHSECCIAIDILMSLLFNQHLDIIKIHLLYFLQVGICGNSGSFAAQDEIMNERHYKKMVNVFKHLSSKTIPKCDVSNKTKVVSDKHAFSL